MTAQRVVERFSNGCLGLTTGAAPTDFAAYIAAETQRRAKVVRESVAVAD